MAIGTVILILWGISWTASARNGERVRAIERLSGGLVVTPAHTAFTAALVRLEPTLVDVFGRGHVSMAATAAGLEWWSGTRRPTLITVTEWPSVQRFEVAEVLGEFDELRHAMRIVIEANGHTEKVIFPVRRDRRGNGAPNPLDGYAIRGLIHELEQRRQSAAFSVAEKPTDPIPRRNRRPPTIQGRAVTAVIVLLAIGELLLQVVTRLAPETAGLALPGFVVFAITLAGFLLVRRSF